MSRPAETSAASFTPQESSIIAVVGAIQFVNILDFMMVMPLGPDFATELGIPTSHLGRLAASYAIAGAVAGIAGSTFLDRFDRRKALAVAMAGLVLGTIAGGFAVGLKSLIAARIVAGAFGGPATALAISAIADVIPFEKRGRALGRAMSAFAVASVLGVPASLWLSSWGGWRTPFFAVAALGAVVTTVALIKMPPMTAHFVHRGQPQSSILDIVRRPEARISLTGSFLVLLGNFALIPNISSFVQFNLGYPRASLDRLYLIGGVASFVTLQLVGRWVDRFGAPIVTWFGTALYAIIVYLGFIHPMAAIPPMALFPLFMVASSFRMISLNTLSSRVPSAPERARFQSAQSAIQHVGSSIGSLTASSVLLEGAHHELIGIEYVAMVALAIAAVIPFIVMALDRSLRRRDRLAEPVA
jgi:predicted MFS family arabinose efflux permease